METNGKISVLLKPEKRNPTTQDFCLPGKDTGIAAVIISDGEYLYKSMGLCDVSKSWVDSVLKKEKIKADEVMIMTANRLKEYHIIRKCDK